MSQLRDCTVKKELAQAAASGVQQTVPFPQEQENSRNITDVTVLSERFR